MTFLITLAVIVAIIVAIFKSRKKKAQELERLKMTYERSLKGSNKKLALEAGRAYYSALRENKMLTIYDEQAITNDLSTMVETSSNAQH